MGPEPIDVKRETVEPPEWGGRSDDPEERDGLWNRSFVALVVTQFLVALNDNMFRWLIIPIGKDMLGQDMALGLGGVCFLLPFVLLAGPAGYLADRYSKRDVMIGCKVAEIVVMALGIVVILSGNIYLMLVVLFLMGAQSTMFSPSKYGSIPEIVRPEYISSANGLIGMTTMVACILGVWAGNVLYTLTTALKGQFSSAAPMPGQSHWWISASALIGVAVVGWIASLFIGRLRPAAPDRRFPLNPAGQVVRDLGELFSRRPLMWAALGSSYFWSLGVLAQMNVDKLAVPELVGAGGQAMVGPMLALLTLGIGLGCVVAGLWSAGKVELGIVPMGAFGIALMAIILSTTPAGVGHWHSAPYGWACFYLFGLGLAAGLYDIPLLSFLQQRSPRAVRGRILAAYNFLSFSGMLIVSGLFWFLAGDRFLGLSARQLWLGTGLLTLAVFCVIAYLAFTPMIRVFVRLFVSIFYRVRVQGRENIPEEGGALLVANHVTWLDAILLVLFCPRPIRFLAYADYVTSGLLGRLARDYRVIPIMPGRKSVVQSLRTAREALREGDLVCVFPEGGLSRTGQIQGFQRGFMSVLKGTGAPVIPIHLGDLWGSIFSFERGRFFWKWPRQIPYHVSITFGRPMHGVKSPQQVRLAVEELGIAAMATSKHRRMIPPRAMLRSCRRNIWRKKFIDSTGVKLTGGEALARSLMLRRLLRREVLDEDEKHVGVLLPPSVGALLTNAAITLDRRVAVNLNYTVTSEVMNQCLGVAGIRHVLTSRRVRERFPLEMDAEIVYLEDLKDKVRLGDKLIGAAAAWLVPCWILERWLGLGRIDPDEVLTIIFTSGSTGLPKGVMLTHDNIATNVDGFCEIIHFGARDTVLGILPFFHSFGYTTTVWTALVRDPRCVYHYTPLEPRPIGKLCRQHQVTLMLSTPTFLRSYIRRCSKEDFASLEIVITGAERLPPDVAEAFEKKFGVKPMEGYGTTELSPVVSANIPACRVVDEFQQASREGSVGQAMPGVSAKIVDPETFQDLDVDQPGMLLIKGANVMKGYLDQPQLTAKVIRDGWYVTGDIARIDADGFIFITGRQSRFSKIGGEMVPHIRVEETLNDVLRSADEEEEGQLRAVVTGVPDAKKGERLVVLHAGLDQSPEEICRRLGEKGLPAIWIPSPESFAQVEAIPVLGSGKLDLKQLQQVALEKFHPSRKEESRSPGV